MKKLLLVLAVAAAALAPSAGAGGWATVGLSSLRGDVAAGERWSVDLKVLQHGRTPLEGVTPTIRIANEKGAMRVFTAVPTKKPGVYHAEVVFPTSGTWTYLIDDGFTRTHTYAPVTIGASGESFSLLPLLLVLALALGLAAAVVLYRRRPQAPATADGLGEPA